MVQSGVICFDNGTIFRPVEPLLQVVPVDVPVFNQSRVGITSHPDPTRLFPVFPFFFKHGFNCTENYRILNCIFKRHQVLRLSQERNLNSVPLIELT